MGYGTQTDRINQLTALSAAYRGASRHPGLPEDEATRLRELDERTAASLFEDLTPDFVMALAEILGSAIPPQNRANQVLFAIRAGYARAKNNTPQDQTA